MTNLKQTVTEFLDNSSVMAEELMYEGRYSTTWDSLDKVPFEFRSVDSYGGEGEGDTYYTVIEVRLPNQDETLMVKLEGWYASYDGANYTGWRFVKPKEKTITVYE